VKNPNQKYSFITFRKLAYQGWAWDYRARMKAVCGKYMMNKHLMRLCLAIVFCLGADGLLTAWIFSHPHPLAAYADDTANAPNGPVVLTITGLANGSEPKGVIEYDMPALQALPQTQFETKTMWTEGVQTFQGVELKTLLDSVNVQEGTLVAMAINDYRIEIPIAEIEQGGPIIAYLMNNKPMSVRDKGPLWLVYPYDKTAKYQTEVVFSRSIWQLNRLEIAPPAITE
jgi:hypothetical protein